MTIVTMPTGRKRDKPMTELLRDALNEADSLQAVARATGVQMASLVRFRAGQRSLRLDKADKLAAHFGIESHRPKRRRKD